MTTDSTKARMLGDRYEIGEVIGRGGMAEVHEGRDLRLGRRVAVKILRPDLAKDPTFQARFRREAQSAASLNHPNIVAVYDTGEDILTSPDGQRVVVPYIVMEFVDGMTLRQLLSSGRRLLPERALEISAGVLAALDYAHRHGIVHRDIKPANVMLTRTGDVKVMDFGIARAINDVGNTMTATSAVMGTAQYLSPEQARGEVVDARSDLYSAGVLLYELLTGRPPFTGDSAGLRRLPARERDAGTAVAGRSRRVAGDRLGRPARAGQAHRRPVPDGGRLPGRCRAGHRRRTRDRRRARHHARPHGHAQPGRGGLTRRPGADVRPGAPSPSPRPRLLGPQPRRHHRGRDRRAADRALRLREHPSLTPIQVPNLDGLTIEQATSTLQDYELRLGAQTPATSDRPAGTITAQQPAAGESIEQNQSVNVTVSSGLEQATVPQLVALTSVAAVRIALQDASLQLGAVKEKNSQQPAGYVLNQDPPEGTQVDAGTAVSITVSSGLVKVPKVTGSTEAQARSDLAQLGFDVQVVELEDGTVPAGTVLAQSPQSGELLPRGSIVTITVSTYTPPPPPPTPTPVPSNTAVVIPSGEPVPFPSTP